MAFYTKTLLQLLKYKQKVLTRTVGDNIGINDILQVIEYNHDDIERMFNPNLPGGGIGGENIKDNSITSDKLKLETIKATQTAVVNNDVLRNGGNNFALRANLFNSSFTIKGAGSSEILLNYYATKVITFSSPSPTQVTCETEIIIATDTNFTNRVFYKFLSMGVMPDGNGIWSRQHESLGELTTLQPGKYYIRIQSFGSGNKPTSWRTEDSTLSLIQF